jgi:D-tyrosyl-tRNA(Tyr) deacylase
MRAVVQRVKRSSVSVDGLVISSIEKGLLVLLGVAAGDAEADADSLADKVANLRIFPDDEGKMNRSVKEAAGAVLAVSQFTLLGDARKGRRPSFIDACEPELANRLYERFCAKVREQGLVCGTGKFQAMMDVELVNDGPVTILLDSKRAF